MRLVASHEALPGYLIPEKALRIIRNDGSNRTEGPGRRVLPAPADAASRLDRAPVPGRRAHRAAAISLHILDPGLACRLTRTTDPDHVLHGPLAGPLFESLVGSELLKLANDSGDPPSLYHYRTVSGHEVDFVLEHRGRVHALECKLTSTPTPRHASGLELFLDAVPPARRGSVLLVCTAPRASRLGRARILPFHAFSRARRLDDIL